MCVYVLVWSFFPKLWSSLVVCYDFWGQKGLAAIARHRLPHITLQLGLLLPRWRFVLKELALSCVAHFLSTGAVLSSCSHFMPSSQHLLFCPPTQRLMIWDTLLHHLMSWAAFHSSTCCRSDLIWFGTMLFVYLYVIVWTIYAASTLEAATLNTNLLCCVAMLLLLPLHGYLPLLDGCQTKIYGWRL